MYVNTLCLSRFISYDTEIMSAASFDIRAVKLAVTATQLVFNCSCCLPRVRILESSPFSKIAAARRTRYFNYINISQGSVATRLR